MSMTPNSRGGNGGNGVVIMAGSNTPRLPGSALGLPDLVNRGQITGGNAANNSDYPSPYHSGTSGAGVVAKDNVYIVNYGTITAGRRFRRQRRRGQADRRWQSPGTGERIQHHGPYPVDRPQHAGAEQRGWQAHHRLHDRRPVPGSRRHLRSPRHPHRRRPPRCQRQGANTRHGQRGRRHGHVCGKHALHHPDGADLEQQVHVDHLQPGLSQAHRGQRRQHGGADAGPAPGAQARPGSRSRHPHPPHPFRGSGRHQQPAPRRAGSRACPPAIRCTRPCSTCPWARPRRRSPRCPAKLMPATPHRYATSPTRPRCCRWNTSAAT